MKPKIEEVLQWYSSDPQITVIRSSTDQIGIIIDQNCIWLRRSLASSLADAIDQLIQED